MSQHDTLTLREALRSIKYEAVSLADAQVIALQALNATYPARAALSATQPAQAAQGTGEVGHIAENLAAMIVEWVGDRPDLSENWKPGLAHIIKLRLERLIRTPPPAQPAPVVPEGWKLVPIKCTEAMKDVGGQFEFATIADGRLLAQSMWNELLLATQPPPAQQDQPTDQNFPEAATRYFYDWCDQHGQGWSVRPIDMFAVGVNWARRYATQPAQAHWTEREPVRLALSRVGRVYIAGPMTGIEEFNFPAFNAEADKLRGEGLAVLNPAEHGIVDGAEWADYLRHDIAGLASCERIHLLRGWEKSKGAQLEVTIAQALGMRITYQDGAQPAQAAQGEPVHETVKLSDLIKELITAHGTLRSVSRSLGIDVGYLSRLERGEKVSPSPEVLAKLGLRDAGVRYERLRASSAVAQGAGEAVPYAYAVYFPDQPTEMLVHDLDDLCEDMTNREHTVTQLYTQPAAGADAKPDRKVIEIVSDHLTAIGADGLVCPDAACACRLGELAPCDGGYSACQPGWISLPSDPTQDDWQMWPSKKLADEANAAIAASGRQS